jgi:hypothetical protein
MEKASGDPCPRDVSRAKRRIEVLKHERGQNDYRKYYPGAARGAALGEEEASVKLVKRRDQNGNKKARCRQSQIATKGEGLIAGPSPVLVSEAKTRGASEITIETRFAEGVVPHIGGDEATHRADFAKHRGSTQHGGTGMSSAAAVLNDVGDDSSSPSNNQTPQGVATTATSGRGANMRTSVKRGLRASGDRDEQLTVEQKYDQILIFHNEVAGVAP